MPSIIWCNGSTEELKGMGRSGMACSRKEGPEESELAIKGCTEECVYVCNTQRVEAERRPAREKACVPQGR